MYPAVYLDAETTGRRAPASQIVEVAAVVLDTSRNEIDRFSSLCHPGDDAIRAANPEAMAVNRITEAMLRDAPPIDQVAHDFAAFLDKHWGATLHAYNNEFDLWFLARPPWNVAPRLWGECVMLAAAEIMGEAGALVKAPHLNKLKWPRLQEAATFFEVRYEGNHHALDDARTAALVHGKIIDHRGVQAVDDEVRYMLDGGL